MCVLVPVCLYLFLSTRLVAGYELPEPKISVYHPSGLLVSIPDDNFANFAFHGKINEKINDQESGTIIKDVKEAVRGQWTFIDKTIKLNIGDIIYYRIYVFRDGLGYLKRGEWRVEEYTDIVMTGRSNFMPRSVIIRNFNSNVEASEAERSSGSNFQTKDTPMNKLLSISIILTIILNFNY